MFQNIKEDLRYKAEDYFDKVTAYTLWQALWVDGMLPVIIFRLANFLYKYHLALPAWCPDWERFARARARSGGY